MTNKQKNEVKSVMWKKHLQHCVLNFRPSKCATSQFKDVQHVM